jgi:hypothetical protein
MSRKIRNKFKISFGNSTIVCLPDHYDLDKDQIAQVDL